MKKYWGIIITAMAVFTLTGCGNNSQSKSSDTKHVTTHKVAKASHKQANQTSTKSKAKTSTAFSGLDFTGDWAVDMAQIRFKGDKFIWKYKAPINESEAENGNATLLFKLVSLQGTYNYDSSSKIITLNVNKQSKSYIGQDQDLVDNKYQSLDKKPMPSQIHLRYYTETRTGQKYLSAKESNLYKNIPMYKGTADDDPSYDGLVRRFGVQNLDSKMQKEVNTATQNSDSQNTDSQSSNSQSSGFQSAEDFSNFLKKYDITSDDETVANGDSSKEYKVYEMGDYENAYENPGSVEPAETIHAKYIVTVPSGDYEGIYIFGTDKRIFSGKSASRVEVEYAAPLNHEYIHGSDN